jgi:hypothetical protein
VRLDAQLIRAIQIAKLVCSFARSAGRPPIKSDFQTGDEIGPRGSGLLQAVFKRRAEE